MPKIFDMRALTILGALAKPFSFSDLHLMNTAALIVAMVLPGYQPALDWSDGLSLPGRAPAETQARPFPPCFPSRQSRPGSPQKQAAVVTYSPSARASHMLLPAIWLGLPTIVIIALIVLASRKD